MKQPSIHAALAQSANAPHRQPASMTQLVADVHRRIQEEYAVLWERRPQQFQLAINEAASLAWLTKVPELVFPILAQEKIQALALWHCRQESLLKHGSRSISGDCRDLCARNRVCSSERPVSRCRQHLWRGAGRWEMPERQLRVSGIRV